MGLVEGAKKVCVLGIVSNRTSSGHLGKEGKSLRCGHCWCIHASSCEVWECGIISLARCALLLKHICPHTDHGLSPYCQMKVKIA